MSSPVRIPVGDCRCPGTPHEEDWVDVEPVLTIPIGMACKTAIRQSAPRGITAVYAALAEAYLATAIVEWSFTGEPDRSGKGEPEDITTESVQRLLPFLNGGEAVAERCDQLYQKDLFAPLAVRQSKQSERGQTDDSTSPTTVSGPSSPKHSKRSSPNGTAGLSSVAPAR